MAKSIRRGEKLIGTAGELYTAFELTMMGMECDLVKQDGTDVVVIKGDGVHVAQRVEVKTCTYIDRNYYNFTISKGGEKRPYTKEDCDIIALVALEERKIQFLPVSKVSTIKTKKLHVDTFRRDEEITQRSWKYSLGKSIEESRDLLNKIIL
jgi:hypothetical protein